MNNWGQKGIKIDLGGTSRHHIFDYYQVKGELLKFMKKPETQKEHDRMSEIIKVIMNKMPLLLIDEDVHRDHHRKIPKLRSENG